MVAMSRQRVRDEGGEQHCILDLAAALRAQGSRSPFVTCKLRGTSKSSRKWSVAPPGGSIRHA